jgi:hypothetical protein
MDNTANTIQNITFYGTSSNLLIDSTAGRNLDLYTNFSKAGNNLLISTFTANQVQNTYLN